MKTRIMVLIIPVLFITGCVKEEPLQKLIDESLRFSARQYSLMYDVMKDKSGLLPRTIDAGGDLVTSNSGWWTSGFFPGSLWYLHEFSGDEKLAEAAKNITYRVEKEKSNKGTHDLGFMLYCSFGNGF